MNHQQHVSSSLTTKTLFTVPLWLCLQSCFEAKKFEEIKKNQLYQDVEQINLVITDYCPKTQREIFFAFNRNLKLTPTGFALDSDGDGLADELEEVLTLQFGIKPNFYDSNNDHYPDTVVYRSGLNLNQQSSLPNLGTIDTDGDGLADGLEQYLGSDPKNPDSDSDGLPDELEIFWGANPVLAEMNQDTDLDGLSNLKEIMITTPLDHSNQGMNERERRHLEQYTLLHEQSPQVDRPGCYRYEVKGIPIYSALGKNWLQLIFAEQNASGPGRQWKHFNLRFAPDIEALYKAQNLQRGAGIYPVVEYSFEAIEQAKTASDGN